MITLKANGLRIKNSETGEFENMTSVVGAKGEKGDKPIAGKDFWTEDEQNTFKAEMETDLKTYVDQQLVDLPPSIVVTKSTEDLVDGESPLAPNEIYFVYEVRSNE